MPVWHTAYWATHSPNRAHLPTYTYLLMHTYNIHVLWRLGSTAQLNRKLASSHILSLISRVSIHSVRMILRAVFAQSSMHDKCTLFKAPCPHINTHDVSTLSKVLFHTSTHAVCMFLRARLLTYRHSSCMYVLESTPLLTYKHSCYIYVLESTTSHI